MSGQAILFLLQLLNACFVNLAGASNSERPTIEQSLSSTNVKIVDPFELTLNVVALNQSRVRFELPESRLGDFDILESQVQQELPDLSASKHSDHRRWVAKLTLETIYSGVKEIPPIKVEIELPDGEIIELVSSASTINVSSSAEPNAEVSQLRELKNIVDVDLADPPKGSWQVWLAVPAVLSIAIAFVVWTTRTRTVDTKQRAFMQLADLQGSDGSNSEKIDEAVHIVHSYIAVSGKLHSAESLDELRAEVTELDELLRRTEEMRFARRQVSLEDTTETLGLATKVIDLLDVGRAT